MSLVLSLTSALLATMLQQWARRYIETPQGQSLTSQRARVRSFLFLGTLEYNMSLAVETAPTLLHFSLFLFFAGLILFFFTIHQTVAIAVSGSVGVFAVMYVTLTILPYFGDKCPYRTPMSKLCWYPWHIFLALTTVCCQGFMKRSYWARLKDGFEKSIIRGALDAPVGLDRATLIRLFGELALVGKNELLKFVASIPKGEIVRIMTPPFDSEEIVLKDNLTFIRDCARDATAEGLDENERKSCHLVWLKAFHHITMEFLNPNINVQYSEKLLKDVRTTFADINDIEPMWTHSDAAIRVTSLSSCMLLAKCLLQTLRMINTTDLLWLTKVTKASENELKDALSNRDKLGHTLASSFVRGIFPHRVDDAAHRADSPLTAYMYPIANTLKTLMDADNPDMFGEKLSGLIRQMDHGDIRDNRNSRDIHDTFAAKELRSMFPESMIRENSRLPATAHASASASASQAGSASSPAPAPPWHQHQHQHQH